MKYGMRERVSGAIILIALAVIFVPMLFDDPAPRDERPQPVMSIEQPVPVERRDVPDPQPPSSLGEIRGPQAAGEVGSPPEPVDIEPAVEPVEETAVVEVPPADVIQPDTAQQADEPPVREAPAEDPIADLARAASERMESQQADPAPTTTPATPAGEWAVQVGSFGEPGNAERLQAQLEEQGFTVYNRRRDNNMTTVYVGPFDSSESGESAMAELKEQANLQGLLVRVRE
ncbi:MULTISPECIES: SPOR domain-containing protein [Halomonas]|uniref:Cell division protein DedD n=1 Tax=Halomonas chromatireducens TaxID=507626 RepID=A0A0X8HD13_9GAMM|nr:MULTISPECIES: SPOR domain-containing protein [Halomonas]AMD00376.1 cell division protein DedD [Halomonas chromatireducens]MBZ0329237.1 SPOR domain-containing protein [Halomonas sp. ANAO-440]